MEGRRSPDVEQSFRAASTRPVKARLEKQMKLQELTLRTVRLPLIRPYVLSYRTFTEFEPIIVEARDADGRIGWGEGHISPGSSRETPEGGWAFCREHAAAVIGKDTREAKAISSAHV